MKRKLTLHITVAVVLLLAVTQSAYAITVMGNNPFNGTLNSVGEMKAMLLDRQDEVKTGLMKAGDGQLFTPLITQIPDAQVSTVSYQKGQRFKWMFYRKNGTGPVRIDKDVVWEGNEPLESFEFYIDFEGTRYVFAVPPICGNLALLSTAPTPVLPPPPPPAEAVGASAAGNPGSGTGPQEAVAAAPRVPFVFDLGYMHQLDPAHHLLFRGGIDYPFTDTFSLMLLAGWLPKYAGLDSDNSGVIDLVANFTMSRFFVGVGLGAWLTNGDDDNKIEDNDLDLILNFGSRLFGQEDGFNTSFFVEVRGGVDELEDFDMYGRVGAGLRFRF